jgi:hypothetical protein
LPLRIRGTHKISEFGFRYLNDPIAKVWASGDQIQKNLETVAELKLGQTQNLLNALPEDAQKRLKPKAGSRLVDEVEAGHQRPAR